MNTNPLSKNLKRSMRHRRIGDEPRERSNGDRPAPATTAYPAETRRRNFAVYAHRARSPARRQHWPARAPRPLDRIRIDASRLGFRPRTAPVTRDVVLERERIAGRAA